MLHHNLPIQPIHTYPNLSLAIQPHINNSYLSIPIQPICTYLYLSAYTALQSVICRQMLHHNLPIQPIQTYLNLSLAIQAHIINSYLSIPIQPICTYLYLSAQTLLQSAICRHMLHHNLPIQPNQTYLNLSLAIQPHIISAYLSIPIQPICLYLYLSAYTSLQTDRCRHMLHHNLPIQPIQTYQNQSLAIQPHIIISYLSIPIQAICTYRYLLAYNLTSQPYVGILSIIIYLSNLFIPILTYHQLSSPILLIQTYQYLSSIFVPNTPISIHLTIVSHMYAYAKS